MGIAPEMLPAAILSGGLATRLRPLTDALPKALIDINGKPFVQHQLQCLSRHGIRRVVLCIGHLGGLIQAAVGRRGPDGLEVEYVTDGPRLMGTGGALRQALPLMGEAFFVIYGDSYLDCDYRAAQDAFRASGKDGMMTVYRNDGRWGTSNVEYDGGKILAYDKAHTTPRMRHIDYGLGLLTAEAVRRIPAGRPYDLAELYQELLRDDQLAGMEVDTRFYEVGSPEGIASLREHLRNGTPTPR